MTEYVDLEMTYTTYSQLCDAVREAAEYAESFSEMHDLVHLYDFLEDEYLRYRRKQNENYKKWEIHQELLKNNKAYYPLYFLSLKSILDDYEDKGLLEFKTSEEDKFHLICELIDAFKKKNLNK